MKFRIKALEAAGGIVSVEIDARDAHEAADQVRLSGMSILSIGAGPAWKGRRAGRKGFSLSQFNHDVLALLGAGLTLVEALETMAEKQAQHIIDQIVARLRQGETLSQALQEMPESFPLLYISTVRASERTGGLTDALSRYAAYDAQLDVVRRKVVSASIYPLLLLVAGALVLLFLLAYVMPKFSLIYADMQATLPLASRVLLEAGILFRDHWVALAAALAILLAAGYRALTGPVWRRRLAAALWRVPSLGARIKLYHLARFYRTLGMLLRGGTPIVAALDMSAGLLSPALQPNVRRVRDAVLEGQPLSQAMSAEQLTTPEARRMLRVGERGGRMDEMMDRIASFMDEEIARWVDWFTRLFEPLLMAAIGILIGAIVVMMYLPVFELAGGLG